MKFVRMYYPVALLGFSLYSVATAAEGGKSLDIGVWSAISILWAFLSMRAIQRETAAQPAPVPIGPTITAKAPEDSWFKEHLADHPDCVLCKSLGWIE